MAKFIFVTGGVVSGLGKGISAAAIGQLLKRHGYKVASIKFDPYLNVDPGTMSPYQHGEVFVTEDGAETDLDLGHYERFIDEPISRLSSVSSGQIYEEVIKKERAGAYLGATIQVIPHITDAIKARLDKIEKHTQADIVIVEVGGTVGDIESLPFLEAIRQFRRDRGYHDTFYIHTTLVPFIRSTGEFKTKPTQHSLKELRSLGIAADALLLRSESPLDADIKEKIALLGDMDSQGVYFAEDVDTIYRIILRFHEQHITHQILKHLQLNLTHCDVSAWTELVNFMTSSKPKVHLGIVGKYVDLKDAYLSIEEALIHAGFAQGVHLDIQYIDAEKITEHHAHECLSSLQGILIPGGFGERASEGKIQAIRFAREQNIPFLGICFGMQLAVVEFARHVLGLQGAHSTELNPHTPHPVIDLQRGRDQQENLGGTLRLGSSSIHLEPHTFVQSFYQTEVIQERHRHRYEVSPAYHEAFFKQKDFVFSGWDQTHTLVEVIELKNHPFFVATQYHPEFLSRPLQARPLFVGFLKAARKHGN